MTGRSGAGNMFPRALLLNETSVVAASASSIVLAFAFAFRECTHTAVSAGAC